MTEKEKLTEGLLYDPMDGMLLEQRQQCKEHCHAYNQLSPSRLGERQRLLELLLGSCSKQTLIEQPFYCDYGYNIHLGKNFYSNHHLVILDAAPVYFGDNVFVGPSCGFYTSGHPLESRQRASGMEYALPIVVEDNVWIGGGVHVVPGVRIGMGSVIGAGSVVTRDIAPYSIAVGNPCRVIGSVPSNDPQNVQP